MVQSMTTHQNHASQHDVACHLRAYTAPEACAAVFAVCAALARCQTWAPCAPDHHPNSPPSTEQEVTHPHHERPAAAVAAPPRSDSAAAAVASSEMCHVFQCREFHVLAVVGVDRDEVLAICERWTFRAHVVVVVVAAAVVPASPLQRR